MTLSELTLWSYGVQRLNYIYSAWAEIHDVFGDGHEYDWALEADDENELNEEQLKPEMKYQDVCASHIYTYNLY